VSTTTKNSCFSYLYCCLHDYENTYSDLKIEIKSKIDIDKILVKLHMSYILERKKNVYDFYMHKQAKG